MSETIILQTASDLCQVSFEQAVELLKPEPPLILVFSDKCGEKFINEFVRTWLWENYRITSICMVPPEVLKTPHSWSISSYNRSVVSVPC